MWTYNNRGVSHFGPRPSWVRWKMALDGYMWRKEGDRSFLVNGVLFPVGLLFSSHAMDHGKENREPPVNPSTWREILCSNWKGLRALFQWLGVWVFGLVSKVDLQYMVCRELQICTTGICSGSDSLGSSSLEKASIPVDVFPFDRRVGSFVSVRMSYSKFWTKDLRKCPPGFSCSTLEKWNPEAEGVSS